MEVLKEKSTHHRILLLLTVSLCLLCLLTGCSSEEPEETEPPFVAADVDIIGQFENVVSGAMQQAEEAALSVRKHFWLDEHAEKGPVPNQDSFGSTDDPSTLQWLLDDAAELLDGQDTLFSTETVIKPDSTVEYYLDDTILTITWKQIMDNYVYNISEIKISDPSQFRRYVSDNTFGSASLYSVPEMSQMVNAVVGTSADHYRGRQFGIVVYDREVKWVTNPKFSDICYIDTNGDLIFSYRGEIMDMETAQNFVDENDILFSLSFGPILVDNGVRCEPQQYLIGEINDKYPRVALCQMDELHYLVVVANYESGYFNKPTIHDFAEQIDTLGCQKAYTLDGGNTGTIAVNGKMFNREKGNTPRKQADIIYFCTAIPNTSE